MVGSRVMIGLVIAKISIAWFPIDQSLFLEGLILDLI